VSDAGIVPLSTTVSIVVNVNSKLFWRGGREMSYKGDNLLLTFTTMLTVVDSGTAPASDTTTLNV
jgi:hypothetical protein